MDLQTRKLNAIKDLINLQDEQVFSEIESILLESQNQQEAGLVLKPFTKRQLIARAKQSNKDYQAGQFKTQEQLEKESEN